MRFSALSFLSAALFVAGVSAQLTVNSPTNVIQCAPLTITWTGGTGPYFLSLHSGNDVNGAPLISFPSTNATSLTWSAVNFTAGTSLDLSLRDSSGLSSQSAIFTVQTGGDSGCLNGATNSTSPTTVAGSGSSATAPSATSPSSSGASAANKPTSAAASSASKASSTSSTSNAAMPTSVQYGVVGLVGAAVAAVFV